MVSCLPDAATWGACYMKYDSQVIKYTVSLGISLISLNGSLTAQHHSDYVPLRLIYQSISTCQCMEIIIDINHTMWK